MANLAKTYGLKIVLGTCTNSFIASLTTAHLAQVADYLEIDGHTSVSNDFVHHIPIVNGYMTLPNLIGLGIKLK